MLSKHTHQTLVFSVPLCTVELENQFVPQDIGTNL